MAVGTPLGQRLSFEWKVGGIKGHLARAKHPEATDVSRTSPRFSGWCIELVLKGEKAGEERCGVYLYAHHTEQELRKAGGNAAEHTGVKFAFEAVEPTGTLRLRLAAMAKHAFNDYRGWGWKTGIDWSWIEALPDNQDSLTMRCTLEGGECFEPPRPNALPHAVLHNPRFADVVFRLTGSKSDTHLFAMEPFLVSHSTYFATPTSTASLNARLEYRKPDDARDGDAHDFEPFMQTKHIGSPKIDDEPMIDENGEQDPAPPPNEADAATAQLAGQTGKQKVEMREYQEIDVGDCSYATLLAFLFFLHYSKVAFLKPVSQYLVESEDATKMGAQAWMKDDKGAEDGEPPKCSPHALYRLADRYLHDELKIQAKVQILNSLTIASAAYEAFSALGRDYTDISDGLVAFILQHWSAVKSTPGWGRCIELLDAGALPGGAAVLSKILDGLVAKTN